MKTVIINNENSKCTKLINRHLKIWILRGKQFKPLDNLERPVSDLLEGDIITLEIENNDGSWTLGSENRGGGSDSDDSPTSEYQKPRSRTQSTASEVANREAADKRGNA